MVEWNVDASGIAIAEFDIMTIYGRSTQSLLGAIGTKDKSKVRSNGKRRK
jgi:hypothetical protein